MNAGGSLARCHIYGLECSWNGGNWLHCRANTQLLTIGHAAFETTRAVSETIDTVFRTDHVIMRLRAWATSFLKAIADFNALDGLDTPQCSRQLCIQAVIARNVRATADCEAIDDNFDDAAESIALRLRLLSFREHRC